MSKNPNYAIFKILIMFLRILKIALLQKIRYTVQSKPVKVNDFMNHMKVVQIFKALSCNKTDSIWCCKTLTQSVYPDLSQRAG